MERSFQLYQAGRYEDAIDAAEAALYANPHSADAFNNLAVAYAGLRMWDAAVRNAREAIRIRPGYQLAMNNLAWILQQREEADRALPAAVPTVTPESYLSLSAQLYDQGKFQECIAAAEGAIALDATMAEAYNNCAACYASMGRWDEAIRSATEALRLKPDFQLARNNLTWALQHKGGGTTASSPR
jgi:tetratricopeptide (TPR) repeat protein